MGTNHSPDKEPETEDQGIVLEGRLGSLCALPGALLLSLLSFEVGTGLGLCLQLIFLQNFLFKVEFSRVDSLCLEYLAEMWSVSDALLLCQAKPVQF